eukprot:GILJ01012586.1.p1 GENE.GILJ01012586.1~~GILJ01012586.1.p1  ORF type:complete len:477 (+),score=54.05 GILJ01012586.1:2-1432(+)
MREQLRCCKNILRDHQWLLQSHVTDALSRKQIEQIPQAWIQTLDNLSEHKLLQLANEEFELPDHWDPSLLLLLNEARRLTKTRKHATCPSISLTQHEALGMNAKKQHEVSRLVPIVADLIAKTGARNVVDLGSGQGYLSFLLAARLGVHVIAIDNKQHNTDGALWRAQKLCQRRKSTATNQDPRLLFHPVTKEIDSSMTWPDFHAILAPHLTHPDDGIILIGLHTCGDLAAFVLRLFADSRANQLKGLVNLGCCYNMIQEAVDTSQQEDLQQMLQLTGQNLDNQSLDQTLHLCISETDKNRYGFPLSVQGKGEPCLLGRTNRMLACQAIDWANHNMTDMLNKLFYRAMFQVLLQEYFPDLSDTYAVGKMDANEALSFMDYAKAALSRMNRPDTVTSDQIQEIESRLSRHRRACLILWSLRNLLAPIVEHFLLLDRVVFLLESGCNADLVTVFDHSISPRNLAIVAVKSQDCQSFIN